MADPNLVRYPCLGCISYAICYKQSAIECELLWQYYECSGRSFLKDKRILELFPHIQALYKPEHIRTGEQMEFLGVVL